MLRKKTTWKKRESTRRITEEKIQVQVQIMQQIHFKVKCNGSRITDQISH